MVKKVYTANNNIIRGIIRLTKAAIFVPEVKIGSSCSERKKEWKRKEGGKREGDRKTEITNVA